MWALKNGDLDEVKDYVAKVRGAEWSRREHGGGVEERLRKLLGAGLAGAGVGETSRLEAAPREPGGKERPN